MRAGGLTSISDGIARARQLFADDGRAGATKIILLLKVGPALTVRETRIECGCARYVVRPSSKSTQLPPSSIISTSSSMSSCA